MSALTLSVAEFSDRIQINDLLIRDTVSIDNKDWNLLDTCLTPDAHLDYTSAGGIAGGWRIRQRIEEQTFLEGSLPEALKIPS